MKYLRNDREGIAGIMIAFLAIVVVLIVVVAALALAVAKANEDNKQQDDQDLDGDDVPDPIIGYIVVTGTAKFDNSQLLSGYFQNMESCTMTLMDTPPTMDMWAGLADMWSHSDAYQMKFTVTQPATGTTWSPAAIGFDLTIGGGQSTAITKEPNGNLAIRYHGTYHLLVQLLADEGGVMDEISIDKTF